MDLSKSVGYRITTPGTGLTIGPITPVPASPGVRGGLSGYVLERCNMSTVDVTQFLAKTALNDGMDAGDIYLNSRTVQLEVIAHGTTQGELWDRVQFFLATFNPVNAYNSDPDNYGFRSFTWTQATEDYEFPDGIPLRLYCRALVPPTYEVIRDQQGAQGGQIRLAVSLLARDPRKYLQTGQSVTLTGSDQDLTHRGDYPTYPTIVLTTSGAGSASYTIHMDAPLTAASSLVLDLSGAAADTYTIDYQHRRITNAVGAQKSSLIKDGVTQTFAQVQPGGSTARHQNTTNITSAVLSYAEAWS